MQMNSSLDLGQTIDNATLVEGAVVVTAFSVYCVLCFTGALLVLLFVAVLLKGHSTFKEVSETPTVAPRNKPISG